VVFANPKDPVEMGKAGEVQNAVISGDFSCSSLL
jgi:hypothetical protein